MAILSRVLTQLMAGAILVGVGLDPQNTAPSTNCEVQVTTPKPGDKVGKEGWVRGTATLPPGTFLWVLDHMKDLDAEWWPQGGRPAVVKSDRRWAIRAGYGRQQDIGEDFEIAAIVVDQNTNNNLLNWFKTAKAQDYPPLTFPSVVDGCKPFTITVNKTSHAP
jgi:hypothetical protein